MPPRSRTPTRSSMLAWHSCPRQCPGWKWRSKDPTSPTRTIWSTTRTRPSSAFNCTCPASHDRYPPSRAIASEVGMRYRSIGNGMAEISAISLGSWNTFSRLTVDQCAALLRLAVDAGINLFDIGYYWDKPDTERIFAEAIRVAGLQRQQ